jgi:hypothetical protein
MLALTWVTYLKLGLPSHACHSLNGNTIDFFYYQVLCLPLEMQ